MFEQVFLFHLRDSCCFVLDTHPLTVLPTISTAALGRLPVHVRRISGRHAAAPLRLQGRGIRGRPSRHRRPHRHQQGSREEAPRSQGPGVVVHHPRASARGGTVGQLRRYGPARERSEDCQGASLSSHQESDQGSISTDSWSRSSSASSTRTTGTRRGTDTVCKQYAGSFTPSSTQRSSDDGGSICKDTACWTHSSTAASGTSADG